MKHYIQHNVTGLFFNISTGEWAVFIETGCLHEYEECYGATMLYNLDNVEIHQWHEN